jgi:2,4-dienoyl-CoA reductase (NADPH2)
MVEIIQGVKARVGDMPVGIRLCGHELLDDRGGNTMEESVESFKIAEEAGADYVSVTVGWHESSQSVITRDVPMGHWLPVAEAVKKAVGIPVMMAFRQFLPQIPEKAIAGKQIDFWEMCRPMIADPELPRKVKEGREDEIIPCIACNICFSRLYYHQPVMCSVRPNLGHEGEEEWGYYGFAEAEKKKKILIVGAGPAGLQCAATASLRGHTVTVIEKNSKTGGNILLASKVDVGAVELLRPVKTLERLCRKAGVELRLNTEYTPVMLKEENADILVFATGAKIEVPFQHILTPHNVIGEDRQLGQRLVIIGGSGIGLGTVVFLLHHHHYQITIVEESRKIGRDVNPFYLWQYVGLMKKNKVIFLTDTKVNKIDDSLVYVSGPAGKKTIEADTIIMALSEPERKWRQTTQGITREVHFIGDAKKPRRLNNAIHDGYCLGMVL